MSERDEKEEKCNIENAVKLMAAENLIDFNMMRVFFAECSWCKLYESKECKLGSDLTKAFETMRNKEKNKKD